ncbi:MAG: hypothetical protein QXX08_10180 [Candidatus Bathyarchaeia archaeon]
MVKAGFLLCGDGFVWTPHGLSKVSELKLGDLVLGIKSGKPSWSPIPSVSKRPGFDRLLRVITDGNEVLVSKLCEVFTVGGVRRASELSMGEILETFNIPQEIQEAMNDEKPLFVSSEVGPLRIDSKVAYILGTQVKSPKLEDKVIIRDLNPNHAYEVARLCSEALKEQFIRHKIYYVAGGKKVRVDCSPLAEVCREVTETNIPRFIRQSNTTVLRHFLTGLLDTIICFSEFEDPPTFFITLARQSEFRRFIVNCLRLFGIVPIKTYVFSPSHGLTYVKTYISPQDLRELGLKFIRVKDAPRPIDSQKGKPMSYCMIRSITEFQGRLFSLIEPELHWSPIVDMTPLHRHILEDLRF